ncbi:TolB family protein [Chloroflexota bacterium]
MKIKNKHTKSVVIAFLLIAIFGVLAVTTVIAAETTPLAVDATPTMPPPIIEFPGISRVDALAGTATITQTIIPDTTGAAGHTHYMQAVNTSIAIYRKDGLPPIDMVDFNTFWVDADTGTTCDSDGDVAAFHQGQPYVMYDHIAGRWVVVDVAYDPISDIDTGPYYLCIAVSNSLMAPMDPVATPGDYFNGGYWYYYAIEIFHQQEKFYPDMPKLGLWPDGYYMSVDLFDVNNNGKAWSPRGVKVYALNREKMTAGDPFIVQDFYLTEGKGYEHLVPSNLLGNPPDAGIPNYFAAIDTGKFYIWEFKVDWSNPDYSEFGIEKNGKKQEPNVTLNTGVNDWPTGPIVDQPVVTDTQRVDIHGDRLMSPLQYRILDGVPSLWATHTIEDPSNAERYGLRWYEVQVDDGLANFNQVGFYAPDDASRWLGSLATDRAGNMALGFSISSDTIFPAIKYAGRLRNEPAGELLHYENWLSLLSLPAPFLGSQEDGNATPNDGPWGRQSQMSIDPMDDCVFWYTNMYYETTGMDWSTRIGWFSFPECRGGETTRISLHTDGYQGNDNSGLDRYVYEMYQVGVSADGRYVAFSSDATNLVDDDTNGHRDVFLRDRDTDDDEIFDEPGAVTTTRISMAHDGTQTNADSWEVSISYDGRYIAYSSDASNITDTYNNAARDVFIYDRVTTSTELVSLANGSTTQQGNNTSDQPFISGDGQFVAFRSFSHNLVDGDENDSSDIFVRDLTDTPNRNNTYRVSVATDGTERIGDSYAPTLSETGQFVAFGSEAPDLAVGDADTVRDVFVHDRLGDPTPTTTLVSVNTAGAKMGEDSFTPFISGNGAWVVFASLADLTDDTSDSNGLADIYVRHIVDPLTTTRVSVSFFGTQSMGGNSYSPTISRDGRYVSFASEAFNLDVTLPDNNGRRDVFLHDRQLALEGIYDFGLTSRISLAYDGTESNGWSFAPMVAPYGRHVAYVSEASDLVAGDTNNHWDVFAYDSQRIVPIFLSIPANIPGSIGSTVTVPVFFSGNSSAIDSTTFSIDFDEDCLSFDPTDIEPIGDPDGIPDAVQFLINSNFITTATYDAAETEGEIEISIYDHLAPRTAIPDGEILNVEFTVKATCAAPPGSTRSARVGFSNDLAPSFGTYGVSIPGLSLDGYVRILEGLLGDCNGDNRVDAGDLSALVLEIFDGDDVLPENTPGGTFPGNPVGCNPNQDFLVDAGDLSCTVMIIFGNTGCTGVSATAGELMYIQLAAPAPNASRQPQTEDQP